MYRMCNLFVVIVIMATMLVLGAGPVFAQGPEFFVDNCSEDPEVVELGTRIPTPGDKSPDPCVEPFGIGSHRPVAFE